MIKFIVKRMAIRINEDLNDVKWFFCEFEEEKIAWISAQNKKCYLHNTTGKPYDSRLFVYKEWSIEDIKNERALLSDFNDLPLSMFLQLIKAAAD